MLLLSPVVCKILIPTSERSSQMLFTIVTLTITVLGVMFSHGTFDPKN